MTPPLDPILASLLAAPADPNAPPLSARPIEEVRAETRAAILGVDTPGPAMRTVVEDAIPVSGARIGVRLYTPSSTESPGPGLVFFHGGGWVQCDLDTHDSLCRVLADESGAVVASVDYRLAPEYSFPTPYQDALAAAKWFYHEAPRLGVDRRRIAVGGDSAGGNLAATVALALRSSTGLRLRYQLLLYPVTDLVGEFESRRQFGRGYWLDNMPFYTEAYCRAEVDRLDPRASPLRATGLTGLPPARIVTAGYDPLHDEGLAYAERLRASGVVVDYVDYPTMIHGFLSLRAILPAGAAALAECGRALRAALG